MESTPKPDIHQHQRQTTLTRAADIASCVAVGYIAVLFLWGVIFGNLPIPRNLLIVTGLLDAAPAAAGIIWLITRHIAPRMRDDFFENPGRVILFAVVPAISFILLKLIIDIFLH